VPEHRLDTADGRVLHVLDVGPPDGQPILVHGGTPNSRLMYPRDVERAQRRGVRLISYDRPGYGGSTRHVGRSIADGAADARAIAAGRGIEQFGVWGISGGGPYALACAALLDDLVPAVAVLASTAPWGSEGLDFFDGMGELNAEDIKLLLKDRPAARAKCERDRVELLTSTPEQVTAFLETLLGPADKAVLTGAHAEFMVRGMQAGLAPGSDGWWDDAEAEMAPWGFELAEIRTPVRLHHGRQDKFVPFGHGEWLARHIPGVDARLTDDDGHLTLTDRHLDDIHTWLLARMG
jgi:pimeloyl-ACP methyl ester carboxylesterase